MSRPVLDFFVEFASTYSYPAAMRIGARAGGVAVRWRPFLLGPIFHGQGWDDSPFNLSGQGALHARDLERTCDRLGLPFRRPDPFHAELLRRLAHVGLDEGWGEAFCRAVYAAEFGEGRPIGDEAVLRDVLTGLGIASEPVLARARSDDIKTRLRDTTAEAQRLGVFGAPSFVCADGELFWGHDRMAEALAWVVRPPGGRA